MWNPSPLVDCAPLVACVPFLALAASVPLVRITIWGQKQRRNRGYKEDNY
jgi:hypothetical protein